MIQRSTRPHSQCSNVMQHQNTLDAYDVLVLSSFSSLLLAVACNVCFGLVVLNAASCSLLLRV